MTLALVSQLEARIDLLESEARILRAKHELLERDYAELDTRDRANREILRHYAPRSVVRFGHD